MAPVLDGNDRPVLYIGDHDWRGHKIEDNSRRVLVQAANRPDLDEDGWRRIALTAEQVDEHELDPIQKYDKVLRRSEPAVEVEALGQGTVTGIVQEALDELLPQPLAEVREREEDQRALALARLNGGGPE